MRWLYVTIALLAASASLVAWIYLRDRDTNWRLPEHAITQRASKLGHRDRQPIRRQTLIDHQ